MLPPKESASPYLVNPVTVNTTGSGVRTSTRSPNWNPPATAEPLSITISLLVLGATPVATRWGFNESSVIQLSARVGGPLPPNGVPSLPTICAKPLMTGCAVRTPSTCSISGSNSAGTAAFTSPRCPLTIVLPCTTASTPALADAKTSSKDARIVSPSTSVPVRKLTPSAIAEISPIRRRLCPSAPLRAKVRIIG